MVTLSVKNKIRRTLIWDVHLRNKDVRNDFGLPLIAVRIMWERMKGSCGIHNTHMYS